MHSDHICQVARSKKYQNARVTKWQLHHTKISLYYVQFYVKLVLKLSSLPLPLPLALLPNQFLVVDQHPWKQAVSDFVIFFLLPNQ
jgi:hypothetical protein